MKQVLRLFVLLSVVCLLCSCDTKTKRQLSKFYQENEKLTAQAQEQKEQIRLLEKQVKKQQSEIASLKRKETERSSAEGDEAGQKEQFDAMKKQAETVIRKLRHDVKVRDEDIRGLEERLASAKQGNVRAQRAAPAKQSRLTVPRSLAGPRKAGGGVHIPGRTCSIKNHGCRLPPP